MSSIQWDNSINAQSMFIVIIIIEAITSGAGSNVE